MSNIIAIKAESLGAELEPSYTFLLNAILGDLSWLDEVDIDSLLALVEEPDVCMPWAKRKPSQPGMLPQQRFDV